MAYNELRDREKLYKRASRVIRAIEMLGRLILILSFPPVIPLMLVLLCGEIYFFYGFFGGIGFGAILIYTARKLEERTPLPPKLSPREREFF